MGRPYAAVVMAVLIGCTQGGLQSAIKLSQPNTAPPAFSAPSEAVLNKFRVPQADGAGEQFLGGMYVYTGLLPNLAQEQGIPYETYLDTYFKNLTDKGFNLFYISAGNFDPLIALSEKYKFKIIFQIDGCYLYNPTLEEARAKAACAIPIINKYKDHPNVLAFSVREEPSIGLMDALMEYYRTVRASVPDAPFHLLLNWSDTVKYKFDQSVMPIVMGTDRYTFWGWEWSGGGYASTPAFALKTYNHEMDFFRAPSDASGSLYQAVFTTSFWLETIREADVLAKHPNEYPRVKELVALGNQGWKDLGGGRWMYVRYYNPPPNATKAMIWLSVLGGANIIMEWTAIPTTQATRDMYEKKQYLQQDIPNTVGGVHNPGLDNKGTYELTEYSDTFRKLQDYGWIINRMRVSPSQNIVTTSNPKVLAKPFDVPGFRGKVIVLVNTDIGTWPHNSPWLSVSGINQHPVQTRRIG